MQRNNEKSRPNILSHGSPDSLLLFALKYCFAILIFDTTIVFFQATNHQAVFSSTPVNTFSFQSDFCFAGRMRYIDRVQENSYRLTVKLSNWIWAQFAITASDVYKNEIQRSTIVARELHTFTFKNISEVVICTILVRAKKLHEAYLALGDIRVQRFLVFITS